MFTYFKTFSRYLPIAKTTHLFALSHYFNKSLILNPTPERNVVTSSQCFKRPTITAEQNVRFIKNFEELDKNHDGFLTLEETKLAVKKSIDWLTDSHINAIFEDEIPKYSLDQYLSTINDVLKFKNRVEDAFHFVFVKFDVDKDGKLNAKEVTALMNEMYGSDDKLSKEEHIAGILEYDNDGDGKVTFEEFKKYWWFAPGNNPFEQ